MAVSGPGFQSSNPGSSFHNMWATKQITDYSRSDCTELYED